MNAACTGYCGGMHDSRDMRATDDGLMCGSCYLTRLRVNKRLYHAVRDTDEADD